MVMIDIAYKVSKQSSLTLITNIWTFPSILSLEKELEGRKSCRSSSFQTITFTFPPYFLFPKESYINLLSSNSISVERKRTRLCKWAAYVSTIDPLGQPTALPVVIIVFVHVVCPYFRPQFSKQNKFQEKTMFATGETVGLAEWIIDDTCLVHCCISYFLQ